MASSGASVSVKGLGDGDREGMVRVNSLCQRSRRADIASLCHPVHRPTANTRSTMVAAANRFLSKLFLLRKTFSAYLNVCVFGPRRSSLNILERVVRLVVSSLPGNLILPV